MSRDRSIRVICYDIASNRSRQRVADLLEDLATRVQKSVFEARLTDREAAALAQRLRPLLESEDKLTIYALGPEGLRRSLALGATQLPEEQDFWLL